MTEQNLTLSEAAIRDWIASNVPTVDFSGKRVLLIVPDATRTAPLPLLYAAIKEHLQPVAAARDVLVALGTHPPMTDEQIGSLLGVTVELFAVRLYGDLVAELGNGFRRPVGCACC